MVKKYKVYFSIILAVLIAQAVLLVLPFDLTVANPFMALLSVLSLRQGKIAGIIWGTILGLASDAWTMHYLGFHGLSFTLIGYFLGWVGVRFLLQGYIPLFLFTIASYIVDSLVVACLLLLFETRLSSGITIPILVGAVTTASMSVVIGFLFDRFDSGDKS